VKVTRANAGHETAGIRAPLPRGDDRHSGRALGRLRSGADQHGDGSRCGVGRPTVLASIDGPERARRASAP
jgi:hypothetical protein